jgi:hypothetical protein
MPIITAASFPTPHLALRSSDEVERGRARQFADEQAQAACALLPALRGDLRAATSRHDRVAAFARTYEALVRWRAELAERTPWHPGDEPHDPSRFTLSIRDGGPNFDRIGHIGRLRENPTWNPVDRTYYGGRPTPAHLIMLEYGRIAEKRFTTEAPDADTLWNPVTLPDDTRMIGNSLVRGMAASRVAAALRARLRRRGVPTTQLETGGDPMYVVTAADDARDRMFHAAMTVLADAEAGDVGAWQAARYLLYQAPMMKKGSDAVTRTFLVTVGALLFHRAPTLEQDVDLRCIVSGQPAATTMPADPRY